MSTRTREERIRFNIEVCQALLKKTEDLVQGDLEYLRDEVSQLYQDVSLLLEKLKLDEELKKLKDFFHE